MFPSSGSFRLGLGWKVAIGQGYSGISIAEGLAVTMHESGDASFVVAFDVHSGVERWRREVGPGYPGVNGSFPGPISTPLIAGGVVIALERRGRLTGLDTATGDLLWSVDLPADYGSVPSPLYGFGTSPILLEGTVIVQIGAPDAAVAGFDPVSGRHLWSLGSDTIHFQTPVPIRLNGQRQVLAAGASELAGIDPATGELLWQYDHGGEGATGVQSMVPVVVGPEQVLLTSKGDSASLVEFVSDASGIVVREAWEQRTIRNTYNVPVYHDGYLYAYSSRFLVCVDAETGERLWRSRPPGDGFLLLVDGHLVIVTKRGVLSVVKASPDGYEEVASLQLFDDLVWTPPAFANGSVYARSQSEIARVDIRAATRLTDADTRPSDAEPGRLPDGEFERFLTEVGRSNDKTALIDQFVGSVDQFPLIEGERRVHFIYRGPGDDLAVAGDMFGMRQERSMARVPGTDLFYSSVDIDPDVRVNYHFIRDYEEILDPRNPRSTTTGMYGPEMDVNFSGENPIQVSWLAMPQWEPPAHLTAVAADARRGHLERHELDSDVLGRPVVVEVYVPAGYDAETERRYPVAYYHGGDHALERGEFQTSLDNLLGTEVRPLLGVFIEFIDTRLSVDRYMEMWAKELVPFVDTTYRTVASREGRASIGGGFPGYTALVLAFGRSDLVGKTAGLTPAMLVFEFAELALKGLVREAAEQPMDIYVEWGRYDVQSPNENGDMRVTTRAFLDFLTSRGYEVSGGEVPDGTGWSSWKNRTDRVLRSLFPLE